MFRVFTSLLCLVHILLVVRHKCITRVRTKDGSAMATQYAKFGLATVLAAGIGLAVPAQHASAGQDPGNGKGQETTQADPTNTKIDLDLESSNLYYGLKLLFSQIKANFTIDESLKSLTVTAHLSQVPFRVALETLLKSTSTPLTYKVENGIYSVVPKVEEAPPRATGDRPDVRTKGRRGIQIRDYSSRKSERYRSGNRIWRQHSQHRL